MVFRRKVIIVFLTLISLSLIQIVHSQTWTQLFPTGSTPTSRFGHTAIYNVSDNRMTIFGGTISGGWANDVWVLTNPNGLGGTPTWSQLFPTGSLPSTRYYHSAIYDSNNNRMTIFGGNGGGSNFFNDSWVLTNADGLGGTPVWLKLNPSGPFPPAREGHTAIYDPNSNTMTIFGGYNNTLSTTYMNDLWVLSNANGLGGTPVWSQLMISGSAPTTRNFATAVYDITNNLMILFGGSYGSGYLNDIWILTHANGLGGVPTWSQLTISGSTPTTRYSPSAIYDNTNNRMTVFGGYLTSPGYFNDLWVLNHANGQGGSPSWTKLLPTGSIPTSRNWHTAVYDNINNRMTIYAGDYPGGRLNDVWVLTNANGIGLTSIPRNVWESLDNK